MQTDSISKLDLVFNSLQNKILKGFWGIGSQIPTEMELCAEFNCSRSTVSKAIARLAHERLVERRTRTGTRVVRNTIEREANPLELDACAFIYPNDKHEAIWRTVAGFQEAAGETNRRTLMLTTGHDFRKDTEIVNRLAEFDVKGAALFPIILGPQDRLYFTQMILGCPFPVVLVQTLLPDLARPSVLVDGLHAGYVMTTHLLKKGARKIGFLGNYAWALLVREKHSGYRQAMFEAGLDSECRRFSHLEMEMHPNFGEPLGEPTALGRAYLQKHPDVEAVVCSSDFIARGVMAAALELGLRIPEDLQITGIDDLSVAAAAPVPLTTYRVPYETLGRQAFETLTGLLSGQPPETQEIQIRGELVVRQSA